MTLGLCAALPVSRSRRSLWGLMCFPYLALPAVMSASPLLDSDLLLICDFVAAVFVISVSEETRIWLV